MLDFRCRLGLHRFEGMNEKVRESSVARGLGGAEVLSAGYYRYWCLRCGVAIDADRVGAGGER